MLIIKKMKKNKQTENKMWENVCNVRDFLFKFYWQLFRSFYSVFFGYITIFGRVFIHRDYPNLLYYSLFIEKRQNHNGDSIFYSLSGYVHNTNSVRKVYNQPLIE